MINDLNQLQKMNDLLEELNKRLSELETSNYFDNWIPRKALMDFFDYGDTQIATLLKNENLIVSEIGNRKFIYKESVQELLQKHVRCK